MTTPRDPEPDPGPDWPDYLSPASPPQTYGTPAQQSGAPAQQYGTPAQQYGTRAHHYGTPAETYGVPGQQYSTPAQTYGVPGQQYSAPAQQYGARTRPYGAPGRRRPSRTPFILFTVFGLLLFVSGGAALAWELIRPPTSAETAAALQQEIASRWQRLPAGTLFPAAISYKDPAGNSAAATRVGIAPPVSCRTALEPTSYQRVAKFGCRTMLRATYVDASGTLAVTVGVAVMRSSGAAQNAWVALGTPQRGEGLHADSFAGTITGQFDDNSRAADSAGAAGPYLVVYTAGHTDGQPGSGATADQDQLTGLGDTLELHIEGVLTDHGSTCSMKDIQC